MKPRSFRDFVDAKGVNKIGAWLDTLPKKAAAKIEVTLAHLENDSNWVGSPYVKGLKGPRRCQPLLHRF